MRRDAWQALADPTRRRIIEVLQEKPLTINEVAEHFDISRPAISKQLRILEESDMIQVVSSGRERICEISLEPMAEVYHWVQQYERFWNKKLDKLETYLKQKNRKANGSESL